MFAMTKLLLTGGAISAAVSALMLQSGDPVARALPGNAATVAATPLEAAPFALTQIADGESPWAMAFLPDGRALLTEKSGRLLLIDSTGAMTPVAGAPAVAFGGQGGLGDVVLHPHFAHNAMVYLSWVEQVGEDRYAARVGRGALAFGADGAPRIDGLTTIWRQEPALTGRGHFSHRIVFGPDGHLFIASGDRQAFDPAQAMDGNLGKILRLNDDGTPAAGNPFAAQGGVAAQIWSLGHRNPLGLAFAGDRLWVMEMGPAGGDELNLIRAGANYGWPVVSNGEHYDGRTIPDHAPGDGYEAPRLWWNPAISPGHLMIYDGALFPAWRGDAFVAALGGQALVRVDLDGDTATAAERWTTGFRVRAAVTAADGAIWLLEDGGRNGQGRIWRITPRG